MKLSEKIINELGAWPTTSSLNRVLRECLELARRVEESPVHTILWSDDAADYVIDLPGSGGPDRRVRIVEE